MCEESLWTWGLCDGEDGPKLRVLILGSGGMVGHKLTQVLAREMDVWGTSSRETPYIARFTGVKKEHIFENFDALNDRDLSLVIERSSPDVVVNAIGLVKQHDKIEDTELAFQTNVELPQRLSALTQRSGARLIHLSTDCVFSGEKGAYKEADDTDADDIYGRTKAQGELNLGGALVLRTSYIGRELRHFYGLMEWLLRHPPGNVPGYANAVWSGFPTVVFAEVLSRILLLTPDLSGLYHIATTPLTKYELLRGINEAVDGTWTILPVQHPHVDLSLDCGKFKRDAGIEIPSWPQMFTMLGQDSKLYERVEARD